jgi:putative ABC transport system permease protein
MSDARRGHPVLATAAWGLLTYREIGVVLVFCTAASVAAAWPLAALHHGTWLQLPFTDAGPSLPYERPPAWLRAEAVRLLATALGGTAAAAFTVGAFGVLLLFAALAGVRADERAVRRAVGASRRLLWGATMVEGAAIAAAGVAAGLAVAALGSTRATAGWPGTMAQTGAWSLMTLGAGAAVVVLAGAALAYAFAPSRRLIEADPPPPGLAIPVVQLGVALIVLTAGSLLGRTEEGSVARAGADDLLLRATSSDTVQAARSGAYASLIEALRAGAAYDTVSLTGDGAVAGLGTVTMVTTECGRCPAGGLLVPQHSVVASEQFVSADSFQALGVRLLAGRGLTGADRWGSQPVAVVSPELARRHFQDGQALGRRLQLGDDPRTWYTVVGVAEPAPARGLGAGLLPVFTVYASVLQHPPRTVQLLLRGSSGGRTPEPSQPIGLLARALGIAPAAVSATTEAGWLDGDRAARAWFARAFAREGWLSLLLAALGTAVQMRLWVRSLGPALGVRRALGARRARLLWLVLGRAAAVGLAGAAVGLAFGPAVWQAVGTMVGGLPAWDGGLVVRYALLLTATAVGTAGGPARRLLGRSPAALLSDT